MEESDILLEPQDVMVLSPIQREEPEGLIVADLVRAACKINMAMLQLDPMEHLLVDYANRDRWAPFLKAARKLAVHNF